MSVLFDTSILIDYLSGLEEAREEIERYADRAISPVTWMEVMVGAGDQDAPIVKAFLSRFAMLPIDNGVAAEAVRIRRQRKIRLPDAIILASARLSQRLLITRNVKDFPLGADGEVRLPYTSPMPWREE